MKTFLLVLCMMLLGTAVLHDVPPGAFAGTGAPEDIPAPDFTLPDLNGKKVSLASFRGKVVLLSFWATWCPPCIEEMPSFSMLHTDMRSRGLEIVAIAADKSAKDVRDFVIKRGLQFTILMDESRAATKKYRVSSLPATFLINRDGKVVEKFFGEHDWSGPAMRQKIEALL